ncbi:MAG: hypothetical protein ACYTBX_14610 [Planctomycetota bacterium]|jgi:hypothetical protein
MSRRSGKKASLTHIQLYHANSRFKESNPEAGIRPFRLEVDVIVISNLLFLQK